MAKQTNAENGKITCHRVLPGRSAAIADSADGVRNIVAINHIKADGAALTINITRRDYVSTITPNDTMLPNAKIGDRCRVYFSDSTQAVNPYASDDFVKTAGGWVNLSGTALKVLDPGASKAIPVDCSGTVSLVTAAAETRTLAAPTFVGQELVLNFKTDGGDCVVTCATTVNAAGNNTVTFSAAGASVHLRAVEVGTNLRWKAIFNEGGVLSTVA